MYMVHGLAWPGLEFGHGPAEPVRRDGRGLHMARWKALPEGLDPTVVQLLVRLRRMKDDSGLSLDQLAVRTGYSVSSWERYLGGRLLPPREAAEALAGLVGADQVRLLVLYEAAAEVWRTAPPDRPAPPGSLEPPPQDAEQPSEEPEVTDSQRLTRRLRPRLSYLLTALVSGAVGAAIALLAVQTPPSPQPRLASRQVTASASPVRYACHFTRRDGLWYAGNSDTNTDVVEVMMAGSEVAELQCLLQRAGISPGGIDGSFGPLTEHAVIEEQQEQHLIVDGQVGPQTWALRR